MIGRPWSRRMSGSGNSGILTIDERPRQIGPCRIGRHGAWITVQCPSEFDGLMHEAARSGDAFRAGFLHGPYLPAQAAHVPGAPSMALEQIVEGIEIILRVAAERVAGVASSPRGARSVT